MKKILSICLSLSLLITTFACSNKLNEAKLETTIEGTVESTQNVESDGIDRKSGTPWIDSELEGALDESSNFSVKDDFAANVTKDYVLNAKYKPGYNVVSPVYDVSYYSDEKMKEILSDTSETTDQDALAIRKLYKLWLDFDKRNSLGVSELIPYMKELDGINDINSLNDYIENGAKGKIDLNTLFGFFVDSNINDSTEYLTYIEPTSLILDDSAEYGKLTDLGKRKKEGYTNVIKYILKKLNYSDEEIETKIKNAFDFETEVAKWIKTSDEQKEPEYNEYVNHTVTVDEMKELEGNIPIVKSLIARGANENTLKKININDSIWFDNFKKIYVDSNVRKMCDAMECHFLLSCEYILDEDILKVYDECRKLITGSKDVAENEIRATTYVEKNLSWPLAKEFCLKNFTKEDKDTIYNLCLKAVEGYKHILDETEFLTDKTKQYAKEKLDNMAIHSMYPDDDEWPDYSELTNDLVNNCDSLVDAFRIIDAYSYKRSFEKLGEKLDRTKWSEDSLPSDVNAYNNSTLNAIYICAGYCQGDMYHKNMTKEELYGAIGEVIGHEISHSFDSNGSQYDKNGNLANWWDEEDHKKFLEKNKKMESYFNNISPWAGEHVHGNIVTGEAAADMGGIRVMLYLAKNEKDFDYDKFFRSYANIRKQKATLGREQMVLTNEHPFAYLRINATLQQYDEFFETYDIKEGDKMYLKKEDRVNLW